MTKSRNVLRNRKHAGSNREPVGSASTTRAAGVNKSMTYAEYKAMRDAARLAAEEKSTGLKLPFDQQAPAIGDDFWTELGLPLFFLGGQDDPGFLGTEDGCLVMFSTEENARQFLKQTSVEVRGFTKFSEAATLLDLLQGAKAKGMERILLDITHDEQNPVRCFGIDDLISFAEGLLPVEQLVAAHFPYKTENL